MQVHDNCRDGVMVGLVTLSGGQSGSWGHNLYEGNNEGVHIADLSWAWLSQFVNEAQE